MWKCDECGVVFTDFDRRNELVASEPYHPSVYYEEDLCPSCGSDQWTSVSWCKNCENEYTEETYCEPCVIAGNYHLNRCITGIMADTLGTEEEVIELVKELLKEKE